MRLLQNRFLHRQRVFLHAPLSVILAGLLTGLLVGCAGSGERDETLKWSPERLYSEAKEEMGAANYEASIKLLKKLESRYPFGQFAQQAQLDTAYAYWKSDNAAEALAALDRFERLYPNHPNVDYAVYLRGLINFNDRESLFARLTGEDLSERDPAAAKEAFDSFKALVTRFPNSPYAADAASRLNYLVSALAQNEVHVARYYLRRGAYLAGVNRAQAVVKTYQETMQVEEALAQMIYGYDKLGLVDLRNDTQRILRANYPNSPYLQVQYDPTLRAGPKSGLPSGLTQSASQDQPPSGLWQKLKRLF